MKKQRESATLYRLEWVQNGRGWMEEYAVRARAQTRFNELQTTKGVVEIEFVKVGPKGREGIDYWLDDAEWDRRLEDCIASEGRDDVHPLNRDNPPLPSEAEIEHHLLHQEAIADSPDAVDGLRGRGKRQPIEPDPAYEAAHSTAHDLMQRLTERLYDLPAPDSGYVQWHHVKVMNEVNRALFAVIEIVEKETR